ncbi:MAG: glycosyltransferase family 9 protein [Gemmatimonadaceae bacterium]
MSDPRLDRIAIVLLSAIGDAVHVLPAVTALKRHAPRSRISWFLSSGPASLVRGHPGVDEIIAFDPRRGARAWFDMRRQLRARAFDVVLDFQVAIKAGLLTSLLRAPVKIGFDRARARDLNWLFTNRRIPARANQHVQDQYFEFLEYLGVPTSPVEWNLGPWPGESGLMRSVIESAQRPMVSIAIASSRKEKDWPPDRWVPVIDTLQERYGTRVVLVGGRSDSELRAEQVILDGVRERPLSTLGCTLRELVAVLHASALVISTDSAPMHMAVALGVPVIGLFGMTDPRRTGPYRASQQLIVNAYRDPGDGDAILMEKRYGRMPRIDVEDVLAKVALWHSSRR